MRVASGREQLAASSGQEASDCRNQPAAAGTNQRPDASSSQQQAGQRPPAAGHRTLACIGWALAWIGPATSGQQAVVGSRQPKYLETTQNTARKVLWVSSQDAMVQEKHMSGTAPGSCGASKYPGITFGDYERCEAGLCRDMTGHTRECRRVIPVFAFLAWLIGIRHWELERPDRTLHTLQVCS